jgi:hypothetical protein
MDGPHVAGYARCQGPLAVPPGPARVGDTLRCQGPARVMDPPICRPGPRALPGPAHVARGRPARDHALPGPPVAGARIAIDTHCHLALN